MSFNADPRWYEHDGCLLAKPHTDLDGAVYRLSSLPYEERRLLRRHAGALSTYPRYTYRYRALDIDPELDVDTVEKSISRLRDILVRSRLWLSSPLELNDPFEMAFNLHIEATGEQRHRRLTSLWKASRAGRSQQAIKMARNRIPQLAGDERSLLERLETARQTILKQAGVCCFSDCPRSILMWSHYAQNHTGVCIQFEILRDPVVFVRAPSVEYSERYPSMKWTDEHDFHRCFPAFYKYKTWEYEKGRRLLVVGGGRKSVSIRPDAVTGIILGERCDERREEIVRQLIAERVAEGKPSIRVYRTERHRRDFKLVIRRA